MDVNSISACSKYFLVVRTPLSVLREVFLGVDAGYGGKVAGCEKHGGLCKGVCSPATGTCSKIPCKLKAYAKGPGGKGAARASAKAKAKAKAPPKAP